MKNLKKIFTIIVVLITLIQFTAAAQDDASSQFTSSPPEDTQNTDPLAPDPDDVPIDGGLAILLAAGAVYGIKKCRDVSYNNEEEKLCLQ